jgi:hypothetical protein
MSSYCREEHTIQRAGKLSDIMTGFSVMRSRLTGVLTTPDDTGCTAGADAFNSTDQLGLSAEA